MRFLHNSQFLSSIHSWYIQLLCKHDWRYHCYNINTSNYSNDCSGPIITLGFKYCKKCAKSKLNFIFGNE